MPRNCATENCGRDVPYTGHGYCSTCFAIVLRTGQPPVLPHKPEWLRRLTARDETGWSKAA